MHWREARDGGEREIEREGYLREASGPYLQMLPLSNDKDRI
jgi:hypothetical protein